MAITADIVLRLRSLPPGSGAHLRTEALEDALIVHTEASFGDEDALTALLARELSDALEDHTDPRGVFVLPSVARPSARSYEALIAEVGEGGMWIDPPLDQDGFAVPDGLGALGAVLGSMMQHMPQSLLDAASAASRGDMQGLSQVSDQVATLLGQEPQGAVDMGSLMQLMSGGGVDLPSPMFQRLMSGLQEELERDPQKMQRLAEQLFGQGAGKDDKDED